MMNTDEQFNVGDLVVVRNSKHICVITKIIGSTLLCKIKVINDVKRKLNCVEIVRRYELRKI